MDALSVAHCSASTADLLAFASVVSHPSSVIKPAAPAIAQRHVSGCFRSISAKLLTPGLQATCRVVSEKELKDEA